MARVNRLTAQRHAQEAVELKVLGASFEQIAQRLGFGHRSAARKAYERGIAEANALMVRNVQELQTIQAGRLDIAYRRVFEVMQRNYPVLHDGEPVIGPDGNPVYDPGPMLAAIDRLVRLAAREAALFGLDAPRQVELTGADVGPIEHELRAPETHARLRAWREEQRRAIPAASKDAS